MRRITAVTSCVVLVQIAISAGCLARELVETEKQIIADAVKGRLPNSGDAQFKWSEFIEGGESIYCAVVNSRDSNGNYTGFVPFEVLVFDEKGKIVQASLMRMATPNPSSAETQATAKVCDFAGYHLR